MDRLSTYYHRSIVLVSIFCFFSCTSDKGILYQKEYTEEEQSALAESLLNGAGTDFYYQGSVGERMLIFDALDFDPASGWGAREIGVPYLKRGFAHEAYKYYGDAVKYDAEEWQGYMAYCWLYFYRDYETALELIDKYDALTPDFVDYPQSTSVDYMRGICYLHLGQFDKAIAFFSKHLDEELKNVGPQYIDTPVYIGLAKSYQMNGMYEEADSIYKMGLLYNDNSAELYYHSASNFLDESKTNEAIARVEKAQFWLDKGGVNTRPYVEEFFAIYQKDIDDIYVFKER